MVNGILLWRRCLALGCAAAALACPACGGGGAPVHPVTGQVLVAGRPAARALVTFHPVGDAGREKVCPTGHVDDQGRFRLSTFRQGDGAPAGDYQVTVVWFVARPVPGRPDESLTLNYLPARYASAATSNLRATVSPGNNEVPAFQLTWR
jgi:hypothetical protein